MYNLLVSFSAYVSVVLLQWFRVVAVPGSMHSPFFLFFPKLIFIFIITVAAQRLSKRSAKRQKVIQPAWCQFYPSAVLSGRRVSNHAWCQFYPSAVLYSAGYSSRATGSLLIWRIRSLQTPSSNSAYIMSMPKRTVAIRGVYVRICRSLV